MNFRAWADLERGAQLGLAMDLGALDGPWVQKMWWRRGSGPGSLKGWEVTNPPQMFALGVEAAAKALWERSIARSAYCSNPRCNDGWTDDDRYYRCGRCSGSGGLGCNPPCYTCSGACEVLNLVTEERVECPTCEGGCNP